MIQQLWSLKKEKTKEEGFSLVEAMIAILIIGLLTAIVVPMYINSQNELNSQKTKTALQTAAIAIEQEATDNNGLYSTYVPNELKNDPIAATFIYSYSDSRTSWCLQAPSTVGKLFISSSSGGKIIDSPCTETNIAEGSNTPWQAPIVSNPNVPVIASHTWASNETSARTNLTLGGSSCTLSSADQSEWGSKVVLQYRVKAVNNAREGETIFTPWAPGSAVSMQLPAWLPGESISYSVQARCLISNGIDYSYPSDYSASVNRNVVTFVVNSAPFITTTAAWVNNTTFQASSSWASAFCPAGTMQSLLSVRNGTTSTYMPNSTVWSAWRTNNVATASSWNSGGTTVFTHTVGCLLPNGTRVTSAPVTSTVTNTLQPPVTPVNLRTETVLTSSTLATPTGILWNAVTCTVGTPQYMLTRTVGGSWNSGWITATKSTLSLVPDTNYSYNVKSRCANGSVVSMESPVSAALSFTALASKPPAPAAPGGLNLSVTTASLVKTGHTLNWSAVTCNNSTAEYLVKRTKLDNAALGTPTVYTWQTGTSLAIPTGDLKFGSTVGFTVQARCSNVGGVTEGPVSAEKTGTLGVPTPGAIINLHTDGLDWIGHSAYTCPEGTTAKFYIYQSRSRNDYGTWMIKTWQTANDSRAIPHQGQGKPNTVSGKVRCDGVNANSAEGPLTTINWTSALHNPHLDGNWPGGSGIDYRRVRIWGSCGGGATWDNPHIYLWANGRTNARQPYPFGGADSGGTWQGFAWGQYRYDAYVRCVTPWVIGGNSGLQRLG